VESSGDVPVVSQPQSSESEMSLSSHSSINGTLPHHHHQQQQQQQHTAEMNKKRSGWVNVFLHCKL